MSNTTPTIVQSRGVASSAAAPASFTASFTGSTTAPDLVVALVAAALSGAPTISTPAGFIAGPSSTAGTSLFVGAFYAPGSAALTNVVFSTLTNVNGIAVLLFEVSGANLTQPLDPLISSVTSSTGTAAPVTTAFTPTLGNEFVLGMVAFNSTTTISTTNNLPAAGFGVPVSSVSATSTVGATNVTAQGYTAVNGPLYPAGGQYRIGANLGASVYAGALLIAFTSLQGGGLLTAGVLDGIVGAGAGQAVGI